ncbi:hypothetical protein [Pseudarthrobacter sp. S9]|uniref:hypothetical protein n=1 Tax=Pseudarthrobacter sp. S9 TaxID=3418421 RepID=UPI003D09300F
MSVDRGPADAGEGGRAELAAADPGQDEVREASDALVAGAGTERELTRLKSRLERDG